MANPDIETRDGDNNNNNNNKHQCLCEMTAREFFAGLAMMGMLASHNDSFKCSKRIYHQIRQVALDMADMMVEDL